MLRQRGIAVQRACVLVSVARSAVGYVSRQAAKDAPLQRLLRRFAQRHPRHGYRRAWVWLRRKGHRVNRKRVYRLWCQAGLALPRRRAARRRWRGPRVDPVARAPTAVWACDILHTRCGPGQVVRCLSVVDEYTRECLAIEVASSLPADRVVGCLARLVEQHGAPQYLRTDNGTEFLARRTQQWLRHHGIQAARIEPGKPWQNGVVESFHSRLRDECVDREWFGSVAEAAVIIEAYRQSYNATRPHSSLGYRTPAEVRSEHDTMVDTGVPQPGRQEMVSVSR
jgi:putative transposase